MAEWRERGYVPDSDDDQSGDDERDDFLEQIEPDKQDGERDETRTVDAVAADSDGLPQQVLSSPQLTSTNPPQTQPEATGTDGGVQSFPQHGAHSKPSPTPTLPELSTAAKLEAQLSQGLQTCRDVLSGRPATPVLSDLDSPLSSLPSSPDGSMLGGAAPFSSLGPRTSRPTSPAALVDEPIPASTMQAALAGRSFRPRALMQLHPYTIEYAKYHKDWQARGLPPIRPVPGHPNPQARQEAETQATDGFQSSQTRLSSSRPSSPMSDALVVDDEESQSPVQPIRFTQHPRDTAVDDELPDLADILRGTTSVSHASLVKKRKRKDDSRKYPRQKKLPRLNFLADEAKDLEIERQRSSVYDMPPSPPRSARLSSSLPPSEDDQSLHAATPRPLPTPVLSSDRRITERSIVELSSSLASETDSDQGFSSSDPGVHDRESQGQLQVSRKIKGVLPASWVKLDAQRRKHPTAPRQRTTSPEKGGFQKGLAKPAVLSGRSSNDGGRRSWPLDFGSEEESSESSSEKTEARGSVARQTLPAVRSMDGDDFFMDDVVEEDLVDAMVPTVSRASRRGSKPGKRRQQRLDNSWIIDDQHKSRNPLNVEQAPSRNRRPRVRHESGRKRRKTRRETHQPSVLDAPGFTVDEDGPCTSIPEGSCQSPSLEARSGSTTTNPEVLPAEY